MNYPSQMPAMGLPRLTPAIKRLMLVNGVVFIANAVARGALATADWFAVGWSNLFDGYGLGLLRLLSYQFTHSFHDVWHLLMNMLCLYFFGTMVESQVGYRGTWKLYLIGGVCGAVGHMLLVALKGDSGIVVVGASGAAYAFIVHAATAHPRAVAFLLFIPVQLWVLAALLVFIGVYDSYVELVSGGHSGVSHGAHLGGALLGFLACRRRWFVSHDPYSHERPLFAGLRARWRSWRLRRQADRQRGEAAELDRILAKVKQSGMPSLTAGERSFLQRASRGDRR